MPKLTPTLWIFNAIALPIVGLIIALTPKAPTVLNNSSNQPVNTPNTQSSKKSDLAKEQLPSSTKEPASLSSVQPIAPDFKPSPQKIKARAAQLTPPKTPVKSPAIAPRQVVAASNTLSLPKKTQYTPLGVSPALVSLRPPPTVLLPTPLSTPDAASFMTPEAIVTPSSQATVLPTPPTELPTPILPFSTETSPTPERELSSNEVQSLCQKFPQNSRCKNTLTFTTLEALFAPEPELSSQEVRSLCQKFPLNSRCNTNTATPDTITPSQGDTTPPESSENQKPEERIVP